MSRATIDETELRRLFVQAADQGYRIALGRLAPGEPRVRVALSSEEEIALTHRHLVAKALELASPELAERVEPPLYWSLQELIEWMVYGDSRPNGDATPPLTWAPWEEWKTWRRDNVVEARLELLREELAEIGVLVTTPGSEGMS